MFAQLHFRRSPVWAVASLLALATLALAPTSARASLITASGTVQGQAVSASADFTVLGDGSLQIVLTNTASTTNAAAQVLTNIEFNLNSGVVFNVGTGSGSTVKIASGSNLVNNGAVLGGPGTDISGGYGFATGVTFSGLGPAQFGVSSVSFLSGSGTTPIGGTFLPGIGGTHPNSLDGVDYGVIANQASSLNDGLPNQGPLAANSVVIDLKLASGSAAINLNALNGVVFSYGSEQTGVPGGVITPVPEPSTLALALTGAAGFSLTALRRLRWRKAAV
jgi:hypothetical protein